MKPSVAKFHGICRRIVTAVAAIIVALSFTACNNEPETSIKDPYYNFDMLTRIVGDHYCFFEQKDIDWPKLCAEYRQRIKPETKQVELFTIMAELLNELKDGHVNLSSPFTTSYYRKWWSDYPQDFNLRTLQEYYLKFNYFSTSGMSYKMLNGDVGYVYFPSFSTTVSESALDYVLAILADSKGLIIDIRNNGGGMLTNINTFVGRFIDKEFTGGYIHHKLSPAPNDFSAGYPVVYKPCDKERKQYLDRPILVLTNRSCFSAANDFTSVMKELPNVRIVGARTGGGGGLPFSSELPNGWAVRFSACPINNCRDEVTEFGIDPSPGCEVHCTPQELAAGKDAILDFALRLLQNPTPQYLY